jgi:hypothetical protein
MCSWLKSTASILETVNSPSSRPPHAGAQGVFSIDLPGHPRGFELGRHEFLIGLSSQLGGLLRISRQIQILSKHSGLDPLQPHRLSDSLDADASDARDGFAASD